MSKIKEKIERLRSVPLVGSINELEDIMEILRDPERGCPWDKEQTHETLRSYLIEEAHEAVEAIDHKDDNELIAELGDVLLQVIFHAQIAKERGAFSLSDVISCISQKMLRRHPHVFSDSAAKDSKEVLENWEKIKREEKGNTANQTKFTESLEHIPLHTPALIKSERIGEKSARVQFDWADIKDVLNKIDEEILEIKEAYSTVFENNSVPHPLQGSSIYHTEKAEDLRKLGSEIGDALFSLAQLARWIGSSAEDLTRECCNRFIERLKIIEDRLGHDFKNLSVEDKSRLWKEAKKIQNS